MLHRLYDCNFRLYKKYSHIHPAVISVLGLHEEELGSPVKMTMNLSGVFVGGTFQQVIVV